jgi:hypothetical protein
VSRSVPTEDAEEAVKRIRRTLAVEHHGGVSISVLPPRLSLHWRALNIDHHYLVLPHVVAVAEEFSRRLLLKHSDKVEGNHPIQTEAREGIQRRADSSWPEHIAAWKRWHGITLRDAPNFHRFETFIEARNAIMHGLGSLTLRQQPEASQLRSSMRKVGITLAGNDLRIGTRAPARCGKLAIDLIEWLDFTVQSTLPALQK